MSKDAHRGPAPSKPETTTWESLKTLRMRAVALVRVISKTEQKRGERGQIMPIFHGDHGQRKPQEGRLTRSRRLGGRDVERRKRIGSNRTTSSTVRKGVRC